MKLKMLLRAMLLITSVVINANIQAADKETGTTSLQPFKKSYLLFNPNRGTNDDGEFKIQISWLTLFKAHEFEKSLWGMDIDSPKILNIGFNYTQMFFNDFGRDSAPIVSTDYLPGFFLALQSRKSAFAGFKQFVLGWEHQSNGEYEGDFNRSWDRGYGEVLLGFGRSYLDNQKDYTRILQETNKKARKNLRFTTIGDDRLNLRVRVSWPINVSRDNRRIRDFYGVYELEASIRDRFNAVSVTLLGGHKKTSTVLEISSKRIPFLSDLNEKLNEKYQCQNDTREGFKQRLVCLARYAVAPFDLADNHGAWMLQYFNGYGERIRDFNIKEEDAFRLGYRFSML